MEKNQGRGKSGREGGKPGLKPLVLSCPDRTSIELAAFELSFMCYDMQVFSATPYPQPYPSQNSFLKWLFPLKICNEFCVASCVIKFIHGGFERSPSNIATPKKDAIFVQNKDQRMPSMGPNDCKAQT